MRPDKEDVAANYHDYIDKVVGDNLLLQMSLVHQSTQRFLANIDQDKEGLRYAEGKWSIREIVGHLIDTERVFNYRALRFARGDETDLPGYDHGKFVPESKAHGRLLKDLAQEYQDVRNASIALFGSFDEEMLARSGTANGNKATVLALGFIIVGHELHHRAVIEDKYLNLS
ncbi:MAG: DinB family protein [Flavobacteriales bacterium]|nr:DinB family protein [Flavobacteriales bacterium]